MKFLSFFFSLYISVFISAQELNADVIVDYSQVQTSNVQVYKTLEKSLKDFINNTKWTSQSLKIEERIECTFSIIILKRASTNEFEANITIQSRRPVFNSDYYTTVLNIQDPDFNFKYNEFETLIFNPRRFSGKNLVDVIGFYVYMILGYDADTFQLKGGTEYFNIADKLVDVSVNQGYSGWDAFSGMKSRALFVGSLLKPQANTIRTITYNYHMKGLDKFYNQELYAKNTIANNLIKLNQYKTNVRFYPLEVFSFAKKGEIASIYSDGVNSTADLTELKQTLDEISPKFSEDYWAKIKK